MATGKKAPPKPVNVVAKSLGDRKFKLQVVKSKKTYSRKRRDAAGLAPFHLPPSTLILRSRASGVSKDKAPALIPSLAPSSPHPQATALCRAQTPPL
jgi:hypothetical protein